MYHHNRYHRRRCRHNPTTLLHLFFVKFSRLRYFINLVFFIPAYLGYPLISTPKCFTSPLMRSIHAFWPLGISTLPSTTSLSYRNPVIIKLSGVTRACRGADCTRWHHYVGRGWHCEIVNWPDTGCKNNAQTWNFFWRKLQNWLKKFIRVITRGKV
jgi:hypothetical protein